ncbi:MAG TPA: phosphate ABC transporter ATP-binding protein [Elusimicrobia bacterium]|nr:phosphate ABC transporter ATP-binding protein [Elusimicrobiota bacterium]
MNVASLETHKLNLHYGDFHALKDITVRIPEKAITSIIGPSGCGKSTLLRVFNRMNDLIKGVRVTGQVLMHGHDIYSRRMDTAVLRKRVGMVFQRPNPFPLSIFENVAYGPKIHALAGHDELPGLVENSLRRTGLWEQLKDKLHDSALSLSPEQRQRLCVSRLLATEPEVLLMDEPCSALDPIATAKIEELMLDLKDKYTIVIVTHNMQQAARISDYTAFMLLGELLEFNPTSVIFTNPQHQKTQDYVTGRFG